MCVCVYPIILKHPRLVPCCHTIAGMYGIITDLSSELVVLWSEWLNCVALLGSWGSKYFSPLCSFCGIKMKLKNYPKLWWYSAMGFCGPIKGQFVYGFPHEFPTARGNVRVAWTVSSSLCLTFYQWPAYLACLTVVWKDQRRDNKRQKDPFPNLYFLSQLIHPFPQ